MGECLFLMLEGINGGKMFIEQALNDVTGVNCVYDGGEHLCTYALKKRQGVKSSW